MLLRLTLVLSHDNKSLTISTYWFLTAICNGVTSFKNILI